jgi:hypothetical protein
MSDIIWTMKIECVSGWYLEEQALKICEVPNSYTLESLCDFILESFEFDHDHMHQFFVSRNARNNRSNSIEDESLTLSEIFPIEKSNFLFMLFDFGDDWVFRITKTLIKTEFQQKVTYPRVVEHIGRNPVQYPMCEDE